MAQGALPFQYEAETAASGVTALGGLPVYLDLIKASGLDVAIRKHVRVAGEQGWLDLKNSQKAESITPALERRAVG